MLEFKNALLAEPGAKPQPMPASNVVQHYFTASTEQNINTANTNMSQNPNEASAQQSCVPKKKSKKPLIIAIASVVAVFVILSIIIAIAVPTIIKSVRNGTSGEILDVFDKKDYTII